VKSERLAKIRLSLSEVSDACSVSIGSVHKWADQLGLPSIKEGRERTIALTNLLPFLADRYSGSSAENRDRLTAAQADRVEFENQVRRDEFMPIELHGEILRSLAANVAGQMAGFPGRVAPKIASIRDPAVVRAVLIDECNEVRNAHAALLGELADYFAGEVKETPAEQQDNLVPSI